MINAAHAIGKRVSSKTGSTSAIAIVRLAERRDCLTDTVLENVVLTAGKAGLAIPVPVSAAGVGGLAISTGYNTGSIVKVVSLVATSALATVAIMCLALIVYRNTDSIQENPVHRACKTLLAGPVPLAASSIGGKDGTNG